MVAHLRDGARSRVPARTATVRWREVQRPVSKRRRCDEAPATALPPPCHRPGTACHRPRGPPYTALLKAVDATVAAHGQPKYPREGREHTKLDQPRPDPRPDPRQEGPPLRIRPMPLASLPVPGVPGGPIRGCQDIGASLE